MDHQLAYASISALLLWWVYARFATNKARLPPGPPPHLLVGNIFDLPTSQVWQTFHSWKEKYGDIVYFRAFRKSYLVLNTLESVTALLEKRGSIYSHRPTLVMLGKLMGLNRSMALFDNDDKFRQHRKLAHTAFGSGPIKRYYGLQERTALQLVIALLEQPAKFQDLFRLSAGRIVVAVTYGIDIDSPDNAYITDAERVLKIISDTMTPSAMALDHIPLVKHIPAWFPFGGFKNHARKSRVLIEDLVTRPFVQVQNEMAEGTARPSYVYDLLSAHEAEGHSDDNNIEFAETVKWTAGTMYGAGAETTYLTMTCFVMAMAMYPEKQALAKDELDQLLGGTRLPTIDDRGRLPYVEALIYETLRWHIALPCSLPRRTAKADEYRGYCIPEGTVILPNIWSIAREGYEDSDDFLPERFLGAAEPGYVFGFGRRLCPGRLLAMNSLFIMTSYMLSLFDITRDTDAEGNEIPIQPKYQDGLISFPETFRAKITPRSQNAVDLIKNASLPNELSDIRE